MLLLLLLLLRRRRRCVRRPVRRERRPRGELRLLRRRASGHGADADAIPFEDLLHSIPPLSTGAPDQSSAMGAGVSVDKSSNRRRTSRWREKS